VGLCGKIIWKHYYINVSVFITCVHAASRYCFWRRLSVRLFTENIENCNLIGICSIGSTRSGWKLVTFDLDDYLRTFQIRLYILNGLTSDFTFSLETASAYVGDGLVSRSHSSEKAVVSNSRTTGRKLLWFDRDICYDNT